MEFKELMDKLNFTGYEKQVYMAMLKLNEAASKRIIKESGVPSGRIYEILQGLARKGLITELLTKPKRYKINDPKKSLKSFIDEKRNYLMGLNEDIDKIKIPQIILKNDNKDEFEMISSKEIYHQKLREFKNRAKKEYMALVGGMNPPKFVGYETRHMLKRGVLSKTIIKEYTKDNEKYINEKLNLGSEIRVYPLDGIRFVIIDKKEILMSIVNGDFEGHGVTVYSTNKDFVDAMVEFFNSIWDKGEKIL